MSGLRLVSEVVGAVLALARVGLRVIRRMILPALVWGGRYLLASLPVVAPFVCVPVGGYLIALEWLDPVRALAGALAALIGVCLMLADEGKGGPSMDRLDETMTSLWQQARREVAAVRVRQGWDETCTALGWETAAADPRVRGGDAVRLIRRPALRRVQHLGDRLRIAFRPRADQAPKDWPALVDGLRRHLGMHSADFREHPTEPGTIVATFGPEPLPEVHVVTQRPGRQSRDALRVVLGPKAGGGDAAWVPAESPHLLLAGGTGGGKGGALRVILRELVGAGVSVSVCDPKGTGEYRWAAEAGASVVHDLEGIVRVLREARIEVALRCAVLYDHGLEKMADAPPAHRKAPMVVVLDEAADVLMLRKVPTERAADELRSEAGALAAMVASQGRAASVHLVVAIQRADIQLLGPVGGFLRDNLSGRIGLGRLTVEGLDMLFGPGHRDAIAALTGRPGRALAMNPAAAETEPYGLQVEHVRSADLLPEGWTPQTTEVAA